MNVYKSLGMKIMFYPIIYHPSSCECFFGFEICVCLRTTYLVFFLIKIVLKYTYN